jgi:hypothetical protein
MALAGLSASLPAADAAAAEPSNEQLRKRLRDLDRRIERLERRERAETQAERKAQQRADANPAAAAAPARKLPTKADWDKVRFNMPEEQVRAILGEPLRTRKTTEHTIWSWHPDPSAKGHEVWIKDGVAERVFPPS